MHDLPSLGGRGIILNQLSQNPTLPLWHHLKTERIILKPDLMFPVVHIIFPSIFSFLCADNHPLQLAPVPVDGTSSHGVPGLKFRGPSENIKHDRDLQLNPQSISAAWPDTVGSSVQLGARQLIEKPTGRWLFKETQCFYVNMQMFPLSLG